MNDDPDRIDLERRLARIEREHLSIMQKLFAVPSDDRVAELERTLDVTKDAFDARIEELNEAPENLREMLRYAWTLVRLHQERIGMLSTRCTNLEARVLYERGRAAE